MQPGSPSYDPTKLRRARDLSADEVFELEPRDNVWAGRFEKKLNGLVSDEIQRLSDEATVEDVECHTSSCKVRVRVPKDRQDDFLGLYPVPMFADGTGVGSDMRVDGDWIVIGYTLLFLPGHRSEQGYSSWLAQHREEVLQQLAAESQHR